MNSKSASIFVAVLFLLTASILFREVRSLKKIRQLSEIAEAEKRNLALAYEKNAQVKKSSTEGDLHEQKIPEKVAINNSPALDGAEIRDQEILNAWIDNHYTELFNNLMLNPDQIAQFKALLTKQFLLSSEVVSAANGLSIGKRDPAVKAIISQDVSEIQRQERELLGSPLFDQFQQR